ncbi:3-hydroxyacyl-CoA dehydrogenase NAD-binding domain-containing protein [Corynebacterium appendicis]|uniref:3-hydroxyacyl-CoA dehydrogenase NAD-binding domain-containing protein n=1 Tax=Corynebacterium appendicis TaxID=163202 RepID=UPI00254D981D|nr:3-hydroxyacyl-CoA dehydrogenase NAD-binding domain-containing protein [Corynebacterium appendicis]MDK8625613.1 3-hydroxyacyl-CoA dehydrogenase NAD-binding domain-containing protein [Corynebacterium appendicis]
MATNDKTIAVIGYGTIGESFSQLFVQKGYTVKVSDVRDDIDELIAATNARLEDGAGTIEKADSAQDAVKDAFLVQENGPETLEFKKQMVADVYEANPDIIYASSSSALLPTDIAAELDDAQAARVLIAHPFNPARLLPLVELVPGERTSKETMTACRDFYTEIGKTAVTLNKEIEGYIANRFQKRILDEAMFLLNEGIASPEDIDNAVKESIGIRWSVVGPLEAINQTTPNGFSHALEFLKPSFSAIPDIPAYDYTGSEAQAAAAKVEEAYGKGATQEAKDKRDKYLVRVAEALEGR